MQAATNKITLLNEDNLRKAFSILDEDRDGLVSAEELKKTFAAGTYKVDSEPIDDDFWEKVLAEADRNGDGFIDFKEFKETMESLLKNERQFRESNFKQKRPLQE